VYTFTNRCHESNRLELGDETTKLFLNAKGTIGVVDADIASFLNYVDGKTAEGKFTKDVAAEVERVKQHDETRLEYMTLMMELKQQRREGYDEGRIENMLKSVKSLMTKRGWSLDETMEALDISPEDRAIIVAKYQPV
jgi:hypothetical protein